jgi:site-specific recombinase XerD
MSPLRYRMIEDMQVRNLAPDTQRAYLQQITQFACHFGKSPEILGPAEIRAYQLYLTRDRQLSASSILVAVSALRFIYKVTLKRRWSVDEVIPACRKPQKLPVVMSQEEVYRFLDAVKNLKHRVILTICYAAAFIFGRLIRLAGSKANQFAAQRREGFSLHDPDDDIEFRKKRHRAMLSVERDNWRYLSGKLGSELSAEYRCKLSSVPFFVISSTRRSHWCYSIAP